MQVLEKRDTRVKTLEPSIFYRVTDAEYQNTYTYSDT